MAENTINLGAHNVDLGAAGELTAAISVGWHDELFLREYNDPVIDRVGANTKTDLTLTYHVGDSNVRITGYATNLEDAVEKNNIYVSPGFVAESATTAYTKPRTVGVRIDYEF